MYIESEGTPVVRDCVREGQTQLPTKKNLRRFASGTKRVRMSQIPPTRPLNFLKRTTCGLS